MIINNSQLGNYDNRRTIYILAVLSSFVLSLASAWGAMPNNDGLLYLKTAQIFLDQGLKEAFISYHWPFYSILTACIAKITSLSLMNSAYMLNSILHAGIVVLYLKIFEKLSSDKKELWLALLVIIMFPQFNDYRHYILKDNGFWLFSLLGMLNLCNYADNSTRLLSGLKKSSLLLFDKNIILYHLSFALAFLFRAEAIIIDALLPLSLVFFTSGNNKNQMLKAIYLPLALLSSVIVIIPILIAIFYSNILTWEQLGTAVYFNLHIYQLDTLSNMYKTSLEALNRYVFNQTPVNSFEGKAFLLSGATAVYVVHLFNVLNIFNTFLLGVVAQKFRSKFTQNNFKIVLFSAVVTALFPLGFLYLIFVTSGRYYILSSLLLLLFVPFGLRYCIERVLDNEYYLRYRKASNILAGIFVTVMILSGPISTGYSKDYIKQAGNWYKEQNFPRDLTYTNYQQVRYFADVDTVLLILDKLTDDEFLVSKKIHKDKIKYVLLKVNGKNKKYLQRLEDLKEAGKISVLNQFANKRGDRVIIFELNDGTDASVLAT